MQPDGYVNGIGFTILDYYSINGVTFYTIRYENGLVQPIPEQMMYTYSSEAIQRFILRQK